MSESKPDASDLEAAELERRIREGRKFSLEEAIGRLGGGSLMKGASPVTRKRQAELQLEGYLEDHLIDSENALEIVLLRRVVGSETLLEMGYEQPLVALARVVEHVLSSETRLQEFVRSVDGEWGRLNRERPHFQQPGQPPDPDDPYTITSVRAKLERLMGEMGQQ